MAERTTRRNAEPQPNPAPETTESVSGTQPTPEQPGIIPTSQLVAQSVFDREFGWLKRELESSTKVMNFIILILVIAFVTLLITVAGTVAESWRFKASVDQEISKQLDRQNQILEKIQNNLNTSTESAKPQ